MPVALGALAGLLAGFIVSGGTTALAFGAIGALAGALAGALLRRVRPPAADAAALLVRLDAIDARLARVEAQLRAGTGTQAVPDAAPPFATRSAEEGIAAAPAPARLAADVAPVDPNAPPPRPAADVAPADPNAPPPRPAYGAVAATPAERAGARAAALPSTASRGTPAFARLREWLAGGNTLTRIGIVVLFFGVAFLLRYFAERVNVPIEARLAGVALAGLALAALGMRLARGRPGYGLSLQGAGMGVVYLTVFAAFRLYDVLPPLPAIALLVATAAVTVALALRHDAQALAALAFAGGFMAPILIATDATSPAPLFTWFAVLNAAIFALAWRRSWRALDVLGFVFTFALGLAWGWSAYRPQHYAVVQPFLALFFLFYVGIAVLHAKASAPGAKAPVDGVLVFGVPLVGFALQAGIVRDFAHGEAWSAAALALFYAAAWAALRRASAPGLARLAQAFLALAVIFATLVIPFAFDARWTSAGWAIEAAAVYWLGLVQRQPLARAFALAVSVAATLAFAWDAPRPAGVHFANAYFLGCALIGASALAIALFADRHRERLEGREAALTGVVFAWGAAWWLAAGLGDLARVDGRAAAVNAGLAWVAGSAAAGLLAARVLAWPRASWLGVVLLPALLLAGVALGDVARTTLAGGGFVVWPLAWAVQWAVLRRMDGDAALRGFARTMHAATAVLFVGWAAWEASEWTGRVTADGTVWIACAAALPAMLGLAWVTRDSGRAWPLADHAQAYGRAAGGVVALALALWFVGVSAISPGDPHPLPYVPLANPLDLALLAALGVLWAWLGRWSRAGVPVRVALAAAGAFVALNGTLARVAHHWADVPWRFDALFAHRPLQVAFTLAWTLLALALMLVSTRRTLREGWLAGAALLAVVVAKLFLLDLAALSGLARVVAFLGVGGLLMMIGYVAPLPPAREVREVREGP